MYCILLFDIFNKLVQNYEIQKPKYTTVRVFRYTSEAYLEMFNREGSKSPTKYKYSLKLITI